jgi:hypothetical protein
MYDKRIQKSRIKQFTPPSKIEYGRKAKKNP